MFKLVYFHLWGGHKTTFVISLFPQYMAGPRLKLPGLQTGLKSPGLQNKSIFFLPRGAILLSHYDILYMYFT